MRPVLNHLAEFFCDEAGPTATEYAVMLTFILLVCLVVFAALGQAGQKVFVVVSQAMPGAP